MIYSPPSVSMRLRSLSNLRCAEVDIRNYILSLNLMAKIKQNVQIYVLGQAIIQISLMTSKPLEYFLQGKADSKTILIFLQGWPDNRAVWQPLEAKQNLAESKQLYINFPNTTNTQQPLKWGQDFPVIVQRLKATFDEVGISNFQKKIIIAHDWGCFYTYLFDKTYPGYVNEIISLDIGAYIQLKKLKEILYVLAYQLYLIVAFLLGGWFGKFMTQALVKFMKYDPKYKAEITSSRNYPYFYLYKNKIASAFDKKKNFLYRYVPSVPVVYVYAMKKPAMFHGEKWFNFLKETEKCEAIGMECGHWIMNKYGKELTNIILRRLKGI